MIATSSPMWRAWHEPRFGESSRRYNHRGEQVYLYRLKLTPTLARALSMDYVDRSPLEEISRPFWKISLARAAAD